MLWLPLWLGCSDGQPPPAREAEQFPTAFVRTACARAETCCAGRWGGMATGDVRTRCEVRDEFSAALMGDLQAAVLSGRTTYDGQTAERCLQAIEAAACDLRIDVTRTDFANIDCAQAVRGLGDVGAVCESSWECAPGLFCDVIRGAKPRLVSRRPDNTPCAS